MDHETGRPPAGQAPASDELLRLVFESARDYAIFSIDPEGRVTSWNAGAERLLGYTAGEIIGQSATAIFTPEDRAAGVAQEECRRALATGRAEDDRWQQRKDGSRFFASGLTMPLADRRLGFVKILRDRTERHHVVEQLREAEERFRLLATNIPQLVFRGHADGSRTWTSPQWISFTGLSAEQSEGFGWLEAVHPEDRAATRATWADARNAGEYVVEHRVRGANGEYRWHRTRARPIEGAGRAQSNWVGTMTDIHDLRTLHDRQQVLMAELQHRTRNLLAITQAIATQTLRKRPTLREFQAEFESRLRALSRVQMLMSGVDYTDVDLGELLRGELNAHDDGSIEGGRVHIDGPPVGLTASAAQALGLAIHELATNAAKYGALSQADSRLDVTWRIVERERGRMLELEWRESGVAMPPTEGKRRYGYGTELIERALPYQLGAHTYLDFGPDGVLCRIAVDIGPAGIKA
jgi:PAS domain S-box-containing protein